MVIFRSQEPDVEEHLTTWDWLFESNETSPLYNRNGSPLGAFIDAESKARLDWAEVKSKSEALSGVLIRTYGLEAGDAVTLFSGNNIWYPVCVFAIVRAGARVNGASPAYTIGEMVYTLNTANSKVVLTSPACLDRAVAAMTQAGLSQSHLVLIHGASQGFESVQDLVGKELEAGTVCPPPYRMPSGTTNKDLCGYINFSSGTTGLPKGVMISHHNVIAQCYQSRQIQVDPDRVKALAVMPLFHVTGTWRFCHYPIFMNGDMIMLPSFSMPAMLQAIQDFLLEEIMLVPPILLRLARDSVVKNYDLRAVKRWTSGAAPVSVEVLKSLERRFPWTRFRQGYGATEAACTAAQPPTHYDWKHGSSVGALLSNTTAKIISPDDGRELGPGETGELLVRGPQVAAMGYLDNSTATAESFDKDGYYHTGDMARIDAVVGGQIFVSDRIKEMIKVKGSQVPPAELEDLLLGHEDVGDCAVIGISDEYAGELPKAFVVLKNQTAMKTNDQDEDNATTVARELIAYVKENKVRYKWLAEIEFVDQIPKSAAGKVLRRVLRERENRSRQIGSEKVSTSVCVRDETMRRSD